MNKKDRDGINKELAGRSHRWDVPKRNYNKIKIELSFAFLMAGIMFFGTLFVIKLNPIYFVIGYPFSIICLIISSLILGNYKKEV